MDALVPPGPVAPSSSGKSEGDPAKVSRSKLWICLGLSLLVFLFWGGPIWRHMNDIDPAALWSYAVIPPLAAVALWLERSLRPATFALWVIEITAWKFSVTYLFTHTMWMISPPAPVARNVPASPPVALAVEPAPSRIDPASTGTVEGRVTSATGSAAGVIVYVDGGLEHYVFAPPDDSIRVVEEKGTITASSAVAQVGQKVEARSGDLALHTLIATTGEGDVFSIPLQSSGAWSSAKVRRITGLADLHCGVHQRSGEKGRLVITSNPFWVRSDAQGNFRLPGVPAGPLHVAALNEDGRAGGAGVTLTAGNVSRLEVSIR